jgi:hypothetical protein
MSGAMRQGELPLFDPTEPRVLPQDGNVWFSVGRIVEGRWHQHCYRLALIEPTLRALRNAIDTYLSQGTFSVPMRQSVHIAWLTHAYVDLDTYKSDRWRTLPPDEIVQEILWHCADADIPAPSIILSSGRGFYCKWFWTRPVPRAEAGRALAVNRTLCRALVAFKADPSATDLARVLRVADTVNSRNNGPVEIVWLNGSAGAPTTYDFDTFSRGLPRPNLDDIEAEAGSLPHGYVPKLGLRENRRLLANDWQDRQRYTFNREHWHWGVLEDIRALAGSRYPGGIVRKGSRDLYGHLAACQLARVIMPGPLFHNIVAIAREFLPTGYIDGQFRGHCSTLLRRATQAAEGEMVTYGDRQRTPIYTYSKQRLMDLLEVTPDDERCMTRLISDGEKYRRLVDRRRDAGMMERKVWLAEHSVERERPWEAEGISRMTWYRRRKEGR